MARTHWASADAVQKIFKELFEGVGLHGFNPHSFRHALAALAEGTCENPEDFKAWSQNLGHSGVLTTFFSYGAVSEQRQAEIIKRLVKRPEKDAQADALTERLMLAVRRELANS